MRRTGSWMVCRRSPEFTSWLTSSSRGYLWGGKVSARVYPTKTAARQAVSGYKRYPNESIEIVNGAA